MYHQCPVDVKCLLCFFFVAASLALPFCLLARCECHGHANHCDTSLTPYRCLCTPESHTEGYNVSIKAWVPTLFIFLWICTFYIFIFSKSTFLMVLIKQFFNETTLQYLWDKLHFPASYPNHHWLNAPTQAPTLCSFYHQCKPGSSVPPKPDSNCQLTVDITLTNHPFGQQ